MPQSPMTATSCLLIYTYSIHRPRGERPYLQLGYLCSTGRDDQKKCRPRSCTESREKTKKKKVSALVAVKPENLEIEKKRFWTSKYTYNPQFTYKNPVTNKTLQKHGHPSKKILPIVSYYYLMITF